VGAEFVSTCHFHGTIRPQEREKIRSIQVLDDMLKLGYIRKRCFTPVFHALDGEVGAEMEKLITHLTNLRRNMVTIKDYRLYLSEFLMHLNERNVKHVSAITEKDILTFVSSHPTNKVNIVSALRVLFRFWREEHIVDDRFEELFDTYKTHKPERIPSYFAANEVMRIEQSVSRNSANGKRNYAMLLLASRLGLRASDIANLQFSDIDWDKNMITLTMQKTKKVIELPLLADVGNAIIDYLRHGRPKSDSQNVFLSGNAPYVAATKGVVCAAINEIILRSGVDTSGKHHGPHSLRHSLASAMLNGGSMMPVISESLGHRSTQTTLAYLKIDIRSLQKCALPVPEIADCFYMQRGGAFYG
jgi:site-specific recombinase XerD